MIGVCHRRFVARAGTPMWHFSRSDACSDGIDQTVQGGTNAYTTDNTVSQKVPNKEEASVYSMCQAVETN
jgi:hypothetical protein